MGHAQPLAWPSDKPFTAPDRVDAAGEAWLRPPMKLQPTQIAPHMAGLRTDEEYDDFMKENKGQTVGRYPHAVNEGGRW